MIDILSQRPKFHGEGEKLTLGDLLSLVNFPNLLVEKLVTSLTDLQNLPIRKAPS